jgi:hypothetical protein
MTWCLEPIALPPSPESQISIETEDSPNEQELGRRREIVRQFFNDFWSSAEDKPRSFAERLDQAEDYINERLTACGEAWQLDRGIRQQLGLPPQSKHGPLSSTRRATLH